MRFIDLIFACMGHSSKSRTKEMAIRDDIMQVLRTEAQALVACADRISTHAPSAQALEEAVQTLKKTLDSGGKIVTSGLGKSGKIAQKIASTLSSTGSLAIYLHPTEALHGDLGMISEKDSLLALSQTGNTDELVKLAMALKARKVTIVTLCGNLKSRLAECSNVVIDSSVSKEACPLNLAPTASSTLALALGDAISVSLMNLRGFKKEDFAKNHPGGSLGRQLNLKVSDLMIPLEKVATLSETAPIDEVIRQSTEKKQGGVLVTRGSQLLGIITDGDLRRSLSRREKFFELQAKEVMTANPVTVKTLALAKEALDLMENRPSQISVLPVVDEQGQCAGLIRLHDLARLL